MWYDIIIYALLYNVYFSLQQQGERNIEFTK